MGKLLGLWRRVGLFQKRDEHAKWAEEVSKQVDEGVASAVAGQGLFGLGDTINVGQNVDGSIVVNADNIQVSAAIQSGATAGSTALQNAGAGLTEAPADTVNVGQNADNSIIINANDIQLNPAYGLSTSGGLGYLTQTDWGVNPQTGNDAGPGTSAAPLQTLAELARRWRGRTFAPSVTAVSIALSGTFTVTDSLVLAGATFTSTTNTVVTVQGTMATSDTGTITAYTAMSPSTGVRAALTDAAQDFTPHIRFRIRMTSGTQSGAITWVMSLGGGATIANVGQFWANSALGGSSVNPAPGDSYAIETYTTIIQRYLIDLAGPVTTFIRDIRFESLTPGADVTYSGFTQQIDRLKNKVYGCQFNMPGFNAHLLFGNQTLMACGFTGDTSAAGNLQFKNGTFAENGCCWFAGSQTLVGAAVEGQHNMHDGNGTIGVGRVVQNFSLLEDFNHRGFFGNINGVVPQHIQVNDGSQYILSSTSARFWGTAGNTVTNALRILNGSGFIYTAAALPTATGAVPGQDVVLSSEAAQAWATLPDTATAPNNAYALARI